MLLVLWSPRWMFECHLVVQCPPGIDGFLCDEAMATVACTFVHPVHSALVYPTPLVVVVWHNTMIGTATQRQGGKGGVVVKTFFLSLIFPVAK